MASMRVSRVVVELGEVTNTCFVVMPFHSLFEAEYKRVIQPAIEGVGLTCIRGDEIYSTSPISQDIWNSIRRARLIVAELSGRNPNVMYEVGLAHAIGKPIVLLTRNEEDVPFDLRSLRYIYYNEANPYWGADLHSDLLRMLRMVLDSPTLPLHLGGIHVETNLPEAPTEPLPRFQTDRCDLSGAWTTSWLSIRNERLHEATLVIPSGHGSDFTASMVVTFNRREQQTIVQETLTGSIRERAVNLTGVSYSYVKQESSSGYSLDRFDLRASDDCKSLVGKVLLRHGEREIRFVKQQTPGESPRT
jgi:hypothetical protein